MPKVERKSSDGNLSGLSSFHLKKQIRQKLLEFSLGFVCGICLFLVSQTVYQAYTHNYDIGSNILQSNHSHSKKMSIEDRIHHLRYQVIKKPVKVYHSGIPKIIHQSWNDHKVPAQFEKWIKSWSKNNQEWHYVFWTPSGTKAWLNYAFKNATDVYNGYRLDLQRNDVQKYLTLFKQGGVFVDIEMEKIDNMDAILNRHPCIFAQDTSMNTTRYTSEKPIIVNSFIACRPKHKFFLFIIKLLEKYQNLHPYDVVQSTGPLFLKEALEVYSQLNDKEEDEVFVAPKDWFQTQPKSTHDLSFSDLCSRDLSKIPSDALYICHNLGHDMMEKTSKLFNKYYLRNSFDISLHEADTLSIIDIVEEPFVV